MEIFNESLKRFLFAENETEAIRLIEAGVDVNTNNSYGQTPLHFAAQFGNIFKVKEHFEIIPIIINK